MSYYALEETLVEYVIYFILVNDRSSRYIRTIIMILMMIINCYTHHRARRFDIQLGLYILPSLGSLSLFKGVINASPILLVSKLNSSIDAAFELGTLVLLQ